jgi:hypothetical protein
VLKNWRNRNREWWTGLCWGLVGLFVAVGSLAAGLVSAADAKRAEGRIAIAETNAEAAKAAVAGRRLTSKQKAGLRRDLTTIKNKEPIQIALSSADEDTKRFGMELTDAFNQSGWIIGKLDMSGTYSPSVSGIAIHFRWDLAKKPEIERAVREIQEAFANNGLKVFVAEIPGFPGDVIQIVIGPKVVVAPIE